MKKFLLSIMAVLSIGTMAKAAPGDTTLVQAHNDIWMDHNGAFDTLVEFPNGSVKYRKILMTFTLGRYQCPGNPQYCGDWDYTVSSYIMTKTGDTLELGRFITPYSGDGWPRISAGWKQRYTFDVTDMYNQLKDSATVRIGYSGYSWGFTGNIKFEFIEGTPPRDVLGAERLWGRSYPYGKTPSINDLIDAKNLTAPANTQFAELAFTVSGHGSDATQCSEFCKKFYEVNLNNTTFDKTDIWRDDCGYNHMYPQNGTWIYNRGNWCPGDLIYVNKHKLAGVTAGSTFDLDVDFQNYTSTSGNASYIVQGNLFYYGAFNKSVDASLDDIVAPSNHEMYFRQNPITGKPIIKVQNTGSTTITTLKIQYGVNGWGTPQVYTWTGAIAPLETKELELPVLQHLQSVDVPSTFTATILEANGQVDDDATNNVLTSSFEPALRMPNQFIIEMGTNKSTAGGYSETEWRIYDQATGNVVAQRTQNAPDNFYRDTVTLNNGVYKFEVTDAGCDGVNWWVYPNYPVPPGSGSIKVRKTTSIIGISLKGYFSGDFGCGFSEYFNVNFPVNVNEVNNAVASIKVYPNPAQNKVTVALDGIVNAQGKVQVIDMLGRVVIEQAANNTVIELNTSNLVNGVYNVVYRGSNNSIQSQERVVIAK